MAQRFLRPALALLVLVVVNRPSWSAEPHPVANFTPQAQSRIVPAGSEVALVWSGGEFTEGPAPAADGAILFSDIGHRIMRYDPRDKTTTVYRDPSGKSNGLMFDPRGRLVAAEGAAPGGRRRISITDADGTVRTLADTFEGKRFNSPNDLAMTASGNVYFSDPRYVGTEPRELDFEVVFLVLPDGTVTVATRDVEKPNGILVAPDGQRVYVADNNSDPAGAHQLLAFDVQADGTLANKRVLFDFGPNKRGIDGMTLDVDGQHLRHGRQRRRGGHLRVQPRGPAASLPPHARRSDQLRVRHRRRVVGALHHGPKSAAESDQPRSYGLYRCELKIPGYHVYPGQPMPELARLDRHFVEPHVAARDCRQSAR